jgi:hypothetical protein
VRVRRPPTGNDGSVQTFLPWPDFAETARSLDAKRLGKQRVEVIQIVRALTRPGYGWANHPAVLMWKGYEEALGRYGLTISEVWTALGFADTCADTIRADLAQAGITTIRSQQELADDGALPPWLGRPSIHESHRSALVRKDPEHYRRVFPDVADDLDYEWPVRSENALRVEQRARERAALKLAQSRSAEGTPPATEHDDARTRHAQDERFTEQR